MGRDPKTRKKRIRLGQDPKTCRDPGAVQIEKVHLTPPGIRRVPLTQEFVHLPPTNRIGSSAAVSTPDPGRSEGAEPDRVGGWKQGPPEGGPCGNSCVTV